MIDLIDALRELLEPSDPLVEGQAVSGAVLDDTCATPFVWRANTFYIFEEADDRTAQIETQIEGDWMEQSRFTVLAVYIASNEGEVATAKRSREVSGALDERRTRYMKAVRENRQGDAWDQIVALADSDYVRALDVRGIAVRISGWRMVG